MPNHEWPFSENEQARLELVYSLKTLQGGREPTTRAVFRSLSNPKKPIYLLEMDWLSLPRLAPGRIFSASPHIIGGNPSGQNLWIDIPPEGVETLTLKDAQARLESKSLNEAFKEDVLLPDTKLFHWFDSNGVEYWLPVIELIRKMFVRSPEMARAIIMYGGWDELVKEFSLHGKTLEITLTNHPQKGDIPYLSLIASKPSLFKAWHSVANHLPRASPGVSIGLSWPFDEKISIHATTKKKGSQYWVQELLDVYNLDIPFTDIASKQAGYVNRIYDGDKRPQGTVDDPESVPEESRDEVVTSNNMVTGSAVLHRSSAKKYIHIQTNSLSGFDEINIEPEYNDKYEKTIIRDPNVASNSRTKKAGEFEGGENHLADSISAQENENGYGSTGVKTKETGNCESLGGGLNGFAKAMEFAKEALEDLNKGRVELRWIVREKLLKLPKGCGSRWFLKIDNKVGRSWCMACITFKGIEYYFLEVGRGEDEPKFSISTLMLTDMGKTSDPIEWVEKMIENNGHWDTKYFNV